MFRQDIHFYAHQTVVLLIPGYADVPLFSPPWSPRVLYYPILGCVAYQQHRMILCDIGSAFHDAALVVFPVLRPDSHYYGRCLQQVYHLQVTQHKIYIHLLPLYLYVLTILADALMSYGRIVRECLLFGNPPSGYLQQCIGRVSSLAV